MSGAFSPTSVLVVLGLLAVLGWAIWQLIQGVEDFRDGVGRLRDWSSAQLAEGGSTVLLVSVAKVVALGVMAFGVFALVYVHMGGTLAP